MNVGEDVSLVAPSIDVELVEVAHEGVICSWLRGIQGVQVHPLLLNRLELSQVIEVDATFARVTSKKENAVLEGEAVGARAWCRLILVSSLVEFHDFLPVVCN